MNNTARHYGGRQTEINIMQARVGLLAAFFFLNIYLVCGASLSETRSGNLATCVTPYLGNVINDSEKMFELWKEVYNVWNSTTSALWNCGSGATDSSNGANIATCLTLAYAQVMPEIQKIIQDYENVVPQIQQRFQAVRNCLSGSDQAIARP